MEEAVCSTVIRYINEDDRFAVCSIVIKKSIVSKMTQAHLLQQLMAINHTCCFKSSRVSPPNPPYRNNDAQLELY